jgi:hypothetical protein
MNPVDFGTVLKTASELKTQDGDCTVHPMFVVQSRRRLYGFDLSYCDTDQVWFDQDYNEVTDKEEIAELDDFEDNLEDTPGFTKTGFMDIWEMVTVCFTRAAAEEYIVANKHRMVEPRIMIESWYRTPEMIAIREFLMSIDPSKVTYDANK